MNQIVRLNGRFLLGNIGGGGGIQIKRGLPISITKFFFEGVPYFFSNQRVTLRWVAGDIVPDETPSDIVPPNGSIPLIWEDPYWTWSPQGELLFIDDTKIYGFLRVGAPNEEGYRWNSETFRIFPQEAPPYPLPSTPVTTEDLEKVIPEIHLYKRDIGNSEEVLGGLVEEARGIKSQFEQAESSIIDLLQTLSFTINDDGELIVNLGK